MAEEADKTKKRKGDIGKIHNADEFGNYVHAVTVPMKVMMAAIVVFFAGALAYCVFGQVSVTVDCAAVSDDGCVCYVKADDCDGIEPGDTVKIGDGVYAIASVSSNVVVVDETISSYARQVGGLELGDYVFAVTVEGDVAEGVYSAAVIKDYLNPLRVLLKG